MSGGLAHSDDRSDLSRVQLQGTAVVLSGDVTLLCPEESRKSGSLPRFGIQIELNITFPFSD